MAKPRLVVIGSAIRKEHFGHAGCEYRHAPAVDRGSNVIDFGYDRRE